MSIDWLIIFIPVKPASLESVAVIYPLVEPFVQDRAVFGVDWYSETSRFQPLRSDAYVFAVFCEKFVTSTTAPVTAVVGLV